MKEKRAYTSVSVAKIDALAIVQMMVTDACIVAINVAKKEVRCRTRERDGGGTADPLLRAPAADAGVLACHRRTAVGQARAPRVVMEPTGMPFAISATPAECGSR
jgi:hypothetical protein